MMAKLGLVLWNLARRVYCFIVGFRHVPVLREDSWGRDYPDKRFLIIRRADTVAGLFSHFITCVGWIKYAKEHDMIPVVDLGFYRNVYLTWIEFLMRRTNAWDFFFEQPGGYSVRDVRHAQNVTIAEGIPPVEIGYPNPQVCFGVKHEGALEMWQRVARGLKVRVDSVSPYVNTEFERALAGGVIGVLARGTDYTRFRPHGHPVQPTPEQIFAEVDRYSDAGHSAEKIYLVTEDAEVLKAFQCKYGGRLIVSRQACVDYHGGWLCEDASINHNRERGYAYLKAIVDLSRCTSVFAGRTSGAVGAFLLSKGFRKAVFFDLGLYP